ncbi:MAG: sigma-54-dependent transcriptional regulator [Thermodesulfobacteriota bacterium]
MTESRHDPAATILVVDDDPAILQVLEARLASAGYRVVSALSAEEGLDLASARRPDLVVSDLRLPGMSGQDLFRALHRRHPGLPVILLTAHGTISDAVAMVKEGAADYLTKPFDGRELLARVAEHLARAPAAPFAPAAGPAATQAMVGGASPAMRALLDLARRVAASPLSVLILGESGTGKEMVARLIHDQSPRARGPFVVVDCGATPPNLLESELFGHLKGSFTHALRDKKGLIAEAAGGTLFLDEIGDISPEMQTRLLRFLQEGTIRPVGGTRTEAVDCRVVAATNADLMALIRQGRFREDLYYRLRGVTLAVPPLRERREDIPALAEHFLRAFAQAAGRPALGLSAEAAERLLAHAWPGNVRELKQAVQAAAVLCRGGEIGPNDLQLEPGAGAVGGAAEAAEAGLSLDQSERRAIERALMETGWVVKAAAELLGISRRALHYKIKRYNLAPPPGR